MTQPTMKAHRRVGACAQSLTHMEVRLALVLGAALRYIRPGRLESLR